MIIEIPAELKIFLQGFVMFLIVAGEKEIGRVFGFDLSGKFAGFAATLTAAIIAFAEAWLAAVPPEYQPTVTAALGFIAVLLGGMGVYRTYSAYKPQ